MPINRWWQDQQSERFWLETTDREDVGANLHAPQHDYSGRENWRYSLVRECNVGDIVYHYHKAAHSIIAYSQIASSSMPSTILWAARGSYARHRRQQLESQPSWLVELDHFTQLPNPVSLNQLRASVGALKSVDRLLRSVHSGPLYSPFELSESRPVRMLQGYLFKLPAEVRNIFPELTFGSIQTPHSNPGVPYVPATAKRIAHAAESFHIDADAVDRGTSGHVHTQNSLAEWIRAKGLSPMSPSRKDAPFDLAWQTHELWVAEVKSSTETNQERQLRLALGQVLRYGHYYGNLGRKVRHVIAIECAPVDPSWVQLCKSLNVVLCWPPDFAHLAIALSLN